MCNSTSPEASAIYGPPPSDSVLSTSFPGTSTVVPVLNRPAAGYLTSASEHSRSSGYSSDPSDPHHGYHLLLLQFKQDQISKNRDGREHEQCPVTLELWLDWQRFAAQLPPFRSQNDSLS